MSETYRELQKRIVNKLGYDADQDPRVSIIPIRSDHKNDRARCLTSVIIPPDGIAQSIYQTIIEPLKAIEPEHYYYSPESLHLTIKNIKVVSDPPRFTEADMQKVDQLFAELIPRHQAFSYALDEVVAFKTSVSLIGYCDERLRELVQALDAGLHAIGLPDDKQLISHSVFFGNMTLSRYVHHPSEHFLAGVRRLSNACHWELKASLIHLIICNAVCAPDSRTIVNSYELQERKKTIKFA